MKRNKRFRRLIKLDKTFTRYLYNHMPSLYKFRLSLEMAFKSLTLRFKTFKANRMNDREREEQISILYQKKTGKTLDWNHLSTYREKMQWAKLYDRDPRKTLYSDKLAVREWIANEIGEEYLIPLLGTWERAEDIDFSLLPQSFVLKTNHYTGNTIIVRNRDELTESAKHRIRYRLNMSLKRDLSLRSYEMHYHGIRPMIFAEALLESDPSDLPDYKFMCFDGVPHFFWMDFNRFSKHSRCVFDMDWNLQPWTISKPLHTPIPEKPENFELMVAIAQKLSCGFSHVRVDLYNAHGKVYFGEMTFTGGSGFTAYEPEPDALLGNLWHLDMSSTSS